MIVFFIILSFSYELEVLASGDFVAFTGELVVVALLAVVFTDFFGQGLMP